MPTPSSSPYSQGSPPMAPLDLLSQVTRVFLVAKSTGPFSVLLLRDLFAVCETTDHSLLFGFPIFVFSSWVFSSFLFHWFDVRILMALSLVLTSYFCITSPCISHLLPLSQPAGLWGRPPNPNLQPELFLLTASLPSPSGYDLQNCKLTVSKLNSVSSLLNWFYIFCYLSCFIWTPST